MKGLTEFLNESLISEATGAKIKNKEYNNVARVCNYLEMPKPMFIDRVLGGKAFKCKSPSIYKETEKEAKDLVEEIKKATGVECIIKKLELNGFQSSRKVYFILIPAATDKEDIRFEYIKIYDGKVGDWKVVHA